MLEQFEKCLKSVNFNLKLLGLSLDSRGKNSTILEVIRSHWFFSALLFSLNLETLTQILWVSEAVITGKSFVEITRLIPCLILCFISNFKTISIVFYAHYNNEFIETMKSLLLNQTEIEEENLYKKKVIDTQVLMLTNITRKIRILIIMGLLMFTFTPAFINLSDYLNDYEFKLVMPFVAYYPFNEFDVWIYPWVYIHQVGSGK